MGLIKGLQDSYRIAVKDLLEFERNRIGLMFLFIMPFFMLLMTGFIFPTGNSYTNIPVAVVDQDHGMYSQMILSSLTSGNMSNALAIQTVDNVSDATSLIKQGKVYGAIVIPENFSSDLMRYKQVNVTVISDNSIPQVSMIMQQVGSKVIAGINTGIAEKNVMTIENQSYRNIDVAAVVTPLNVKTEGTVPGNLNYFDFIAPGLLMMIVMMGAMTGIPRAISHEKEIGTFDGILAAPVSEISIIFGKTIAQTVRGFIQGIVVMVIAVLVFGVTFQEGSLLLAFALLFLGIFSFIGLGILLTSLANNEETATILMTVLQFPMMFLTGVFFPIQQMPWFMQDISNVLPLTYAVTAMRKVMVLNAGIQDVLPEVAILVVFGVIMLAIAIPVFRRSMTR